jgi:hypothetical protein
MRNDPPLCRLSTLVAASAYITPTSSHPVPFRFFVRRYLPRPLCSCRSSPQPASPKAPIGSTACHERLQSRSSPRLQNSPARIGAIAPFLNLPSVRSLRIDINARCPCRIARNAVDRRLQEVRGQDRSKRPQQGSRPRWHRTGRRKWRTRPSIPPFRSSAPARLRRPSGVSKEIAYGIECFLQNLLISDVYR